MADGKFILIGIDDERSKDIAEILGNKTCRKILDFLSETKEASEKDISDALKIPINTAEYNINKLMKSGLVEKAKNFFWSRKGRKIEMYKLAGKYIIISPNKKPDIGYIKNMLPAILSALALIAFGIKFLTDKINSNQIIGVSEISEEFKNISSAAFSSDNVIDKAVSCSQNIPNSNTETWAWFLFGGLIVILILLLLNSSKKLKGGFKKNEYTEN